MRRYHNEVQRALILRQFLIRFKLVLKVGGVILVNGEDISQLCSEGVS